MFKISLREWMLVVVIAALGAAWWVDRDKSRRRLLEADRSLTECRTALRESESYRDYVMDANGKILKFLESQGYSANLPKQVYVDQPSKQR